MVHQLQADRAFKDDLHVCGMHHFMARLPTSGMTVHTLSQHCCAAQEAVVWCTTCGSNVHDQCFGKWVEQRRKAGADPVCVFCRAPWAVNKPQTKQGRARKPSTIVNLLDVSQVRRWSGLGSGVICLNL